jgi:DGQHR domain-containing protein
MSSANSSTIAVPTVSLEGAFPVTIRQTNGHAPQAVGVITAGQLVKRYTVPHRDSRNKQGYQRPVSQARVNKLAADLRGGRVDIPTAVLLNVRENAASILEEVPERGTTVMFEPNGHELFVVDGQHRIEALAKLVEENPEKWSDYQVPFVCMLGADEFEEMTQFYVVNSTAKSVRTDLALDLLKQRAEGDPNLMASLVEKGEDWKVEGQTITEELAKTRLWAHRIRFPGDPAGETTIGSAGIVSSLKQILGTPYFGAISTQNRVKILEAYWEGLESIMPEAFKEPTEYGVQKSTGVQIMHTLLISVIELLRSRGMSVIDPEAYAEVLAAPLSNLEGDTAEGSIARGADFWRAGVQGAAGSFSSNAGRRVLLARLKTELPDVDVE